MTRELDARLDAIEARQRAYGMHDPDCPEFLPFSATDGIFGGLSRAMSRGTCECWLADPATLCAGCGHPWKYHGDGHCFRGAKPVGEGMAELACACTAVAPEVSA